MQFRDLGKQYQILKADIDKAMIETCSMIQPYLLYRHDEVCIV